MKLSCPSCGAKYSIADEKVHDRLAKIRCRKCSATIIIDGKVSPPNVYTSDAGGSHAAEADDGGGGGGGGPAPGQYSVDFGDNDQRTLSADDIAQAYRRGELTRETFVWAEGMSDWTAIGEVPELSGLLGAAAAPAAAQPRAAARSGSGRGSAHDLFGGIETAGSEADVTTSAPQPAAAPVATGARNESSVLFSLSALTASAGTSSPSAPTKPSASMTDNKVDDSGLIDLKALTSSVANAGPVGPLGLGTAPLGMAAPLGGITAPAIPVDDHMSRPQGSKTGLYIAGALVVFGAMIAGAIVFTSSKEAPAAAASAVTTPVVTAAPAPAPTPEPKKEELAAPPSTGTAEAAAAPSAASGGLSKVVAAKAGKSSGGGSKASKSSGSTASEKPAPASPPPASEPAAEKPKPKPKSSACNCPPGDLMCAMKCAAGH